ncbi:hypothetical protein [Desulfosporosinus hippei]
MEDKILQAIEALNQKIDMSVEGLRNDLNQKFTALSSLVQEKAQILEALEHLKQVNKAENDKMTFDLTELNDEVKSIRRNLSTVELVTANNWSDIIKLKAGK